MQTEIIRIHEDGDWRLKLKNSVSKKLPFVIPTETVYGLAALYNDTQMVESIFQIKNRPQDNPLIVHIVALDQLQDLISVKLNELPENVMEVIDSFWPGPLTILFEKSSNVPDIVTANSPYVGVRMPKHEVGQTVLREIGIPLVAPSANISGRPSPTNAKDAFEDLNSKVELIFDGGECEVGLESTVIKLSDNMEECLVLRPGKITEEDLMPFFSNVMIDKSVLESSLTEESIAESPGVKYKHYSPKAKVILVDNINELETAGFSNFAILSYSKKLNLDNNIYFKSEDHLASKLFSTFRELDRQGLEAVFVEMPRLNLALKNRLIKAAI